MTQLYPQRSPATWCLHYWCHQRPCEDLQHLAGDAGVVVGDAWGSEGHAGGLARDARKLTRGSGVQAGDAGNWWGMLRGLDHAG